MRGDEPVATEVPREADWLTRFQFFRAMEPSAGEAFWRLGHATDMPHGEAIFRAGSPSPSVNLILAGYAKLCATTPDGDLVILRIVGPGDFCPLPCRAETSRTDLSLWPIRRCVVLRWTLGLFQSLLDRHPRAALNVLELHAAWLRHAEERIIDLTTKDVPSRLADIILYLGGNWGVDGEDGDGLLCPLGQADLAAMIGSTPPTVCRIMARWKQRKLIRVADRAILVPDPELFRRLACECAQP